MITFDLKYRGAQIGQPDYTLVLRHKPDVSDQTTTRELWQGLLYGEREGIERVVLALNQGLGSDPNIKEFSLLEPDQIGALTDGPLLGYRIQTGVQLEEKYLALLDALPHIDKAYVSRFYPKKETLDADGKPEYDWTASYALGRLVVSGTVFKYDRYMIESWVEILLTEGEVELEGYIIEPLEGAKKEEVVAEEAD